MSTLEVSIHQLLKPPTKDVIDGPLTCQTMLETLVKLDEDSKTIHKLKLKDEHLFVFPEGRQKDGPSGFIELDIHVKLQKIWKDGQLKGFKLLKKGELQTSFYIQFTQLAEIWVKFLSKRVNQLGFHSQFKPIRKLGRGSSASVYEFVRIADGARFAGKVFAKEQLKLTPQKFDSFRNQIEIIRLLSHENLLELEGVYQSQQSYYVITECLRGGNLLQNLLSRTSKVSMEEIKSLMRGILSGLDELDQMDIVHRDIKLQNVVLAEKDSLRTVVIDFGLSEYSWEQDHLFVRCGTPGYISPQAMKLEQGQTLHPKSDIFSAGAILHVLLVGKYVFQGHTPKQVFEANKAFKIQLSKPEYSSLDKQAFDLLKGMLVLDCDKRLSARDCLLHPFLAEGIKNKHEISPASTNEDYYL